MACWTVTVWLCHHVDCPAVSLNCLAVSLFCLSSCVPSGAVRLCPHTVRCVRAHLSGSVTIPPAVTRLRLSSCGTGTLLTTRWHQDCAVEPHRPLSRVPLSCVLSLNTLQLRQQQGQVIPSPAGPSGWALERSCHECSQAACVPIIRWLPRCETNPGRGRGGVPIRGRTGTDGRGTPKLQRLFPNDAMRCVGTVRQHFAATLFISDTC